MRHVSMISIGRYSGELVVVRTGTKRKWTVIGLVLVGIFLVIISINIVLVANRFLLPKLNGKSITSTTAININSTTEGKTSTSSQEDSFHFELTTPTTTKSNDLVIFTPALISDFHEYDESIGLSLSHSLYYNILHLTLVQGFVVNVSLRLFTSWEGDDPLYLFSISKYHIDHRIAYRYPVVPERNNTEWQIIEIPFGVFPLFVYDHLAIGMQDTSKTNQIYSIRSTIAIHGKNIMNNTMDVYPQSMPDTYGAAFTYTLVEDRQFE
ncbi:unnamed protein product [Rotaria sordida]|uniref:Uncharacterized protein n=1 Tax=Rotaria sordida TaxID=392033 RepID=A0A818ZGB2_9BILA|nr:unnamed protein product [Rotaria sordida]CAF3823340.1 unnamed protein product [Rotaria sordida]